MRVGFCALSLFIALSSTPNCHASNDSRETQISIYNSEVVQAGEKLKFIFLSKPNNLSDSKLVLSLPNEFQAIINPDTEGYPKAKSLAGISTKEVLELFGEPIDEYKDTKSFNLVILNADKDNLGEQSKIRLETRIVDGILRSYRVKGSLIGQREWVAVNSVRHWAGVIFGPKYNEWSREWRQKNPGKEMKSSDKPYLVEVGRSKWGDPIFDLPDSSQPRPKFR